MCPFVHTQPTVRPRGVAPLRRGLRVARAGLVLGGLLALMGGMLSAPRRALAQAPAGEASDAEPTAQQRQAAAEAYDRGTAAYLARDYAAAARWFETAHRMAPAAPALLQAVRAHQRAGDALRASNLALRLQAQYGDERQAVRVAAPLVEAAVRAYVRIDVTCASCTVDLDGTLLEWPSFFVEPDVDHTLGAHFETGDATPQSVRGTAGQALSLTFAAPPEPEPVATPGPRGWPAAALTRRPSEDDGTATTRATPREDTRSGGLPPAVFLVGAGATVVAGGLLVWSGLDTTAGVPAYEANPTQAALEAGQQKELRTNVLVGVTALVGVTTAVLAIFTDWGGRDDTRGVGARAVGAANVEAGVAPTVGGAMGVVRGHF